MTSKIAGYNSVSPDASPLHEDVVLKIGSATKLITSIALLQCIEKRLIGLDEPINNIIPEFGPGKEILTEVSGSNFTYEKSKKAITPRHLLSHTSGLGYPFTHRLLRSWAAARKRAPSYRVTERYVMPLVFEPGEGWLYGCSLDWAGVVISRLNNGMTLEDYMVENIWKNLGLSAPFPRFNIGIHPEYNARAMGGAVRSSDGRLTPCDKWAFDNPEDQDGGSGLSCTAKDFVAVLADLISDSPKLLTPGTLSEMFTPQLLPKSLSIEMLLGLRAGWDAVAGPISEDFINHGLGGILCVGPVPEIKQPKSMLAWGGASNVVWWMNREKGVAGFFATQQSPFGTPAVTKLVNAWKKDFWTQFEAKDRT